jgi:hypothetical protein
VLLARPLTAQEEAKPAKARLEWTRAPNAEACIDGPALEAAVSRRWGREVFVTESNADVVVRGTVRRRANGGWSVRLDLERPDGGKLGSREIVTRAPDCSSLDDSVALALGLMLDLTERSAPRVEALRASNPLENVAQPPITIPKETLARRAPWWFETTVGGEAAVGILPGVAFGARLAIAIEPPQFWRIELGGTAWQNRTTSSEPAGAELSMWTIDFAICPLSTSRERFSAAACVAQRAGKIVAEGQGFDLNATADETLLTAEARAGASWQFAGPLVLHGAFGLSTPFVRFRFVYRDDQGNVTSVYRMAPVAGFVALGIGARF